MTQIRRAPVRLFAAASLAALAACSSSKPDAPPAAAPVPVEQVREQVRQFGMGGAEKDAAGEKFYEWGAAAHLALIQLARDPSVTDDEIDVIMFIAATNAHTPALFAALRERIGAMPDPGARDMRLGLLAQYEAMPAAATP